MRLFLEITCRVRIRLAGIGFRDKRRRALGLDDILAQHVAELLSAQSLFQIAHALALVADEGEISGDGGELADIPVSVVPIYQFPLSPMCGVMPLSPFVPFADIPVSVSPIYQFPFEPM